MCSLTVEHANHLLGEPEACKPPFRCCYLMHPTAAARDILREPLPIKCVEATFVALLVTCGWRDLDRVAVGFKSRAADGQVRKGIAAALQRRKLYYCPKLPAVA
jgi:hypothetical protein